MSKDKSNVYRCSASIDPYDFLEVDHAKDVKIAQWIEHVEQEISNHRSPFVAADVIFKQMHERAATMHHPDALYLQTALKVLQLCANHVSSPFKELLLSALHELIPALLFTRVTYSPTTGLETFVKRSYAECFLQIYKVFLSHQRTIEVHERRVEVERTVMDRVVNKLDGLWIKFCFSAWRVHCRKIREKKIVFAKIANFSVSHQIAPRMIRLWRRHAHILLLQVKNQKSDMLTNELTGLEQASNKVRSETDRLRDDLRTHMRNVAKVTAELEFTTAKLDELKQLLTATTTSAEEHWNEWIKCKILLFGDRYEVKDKSRLAGNTNITFNSNITDSSALYYRRAKAIARKVDIRRIHHLLSAYGFLPSREEFPEDTPEISIKRNAPSAAIDTIVSIVRYSCAPVVPPFLTRDVTHFHRDKISFVVNFIQLMYSGGHCSLFTPPRISAPPSVAPPKAASGESWSMASFSDDGSPLLREKSSERKSDVEDPNAIPRGDIGARMMEDVSTGLEGLSGVCESSDEMAASIRRCICNTEVDEVRNYLEGLFGHLSVLSKPLNRTKIEDVTRSMVDKADFRVVEALYPAEGIDSFTALVNYITGMAEFIGWPILTVAEVMESRYAYDTRDHMLMALASHDITRFLSLNQALLQRFAVSLSLPDDPSKLSFEGVRKLFMAKFGLSAAEVERIWKSAGVNEDVVLLVELDQLIYLTANWVDPSPFTPQVEKIAALVTRFLPYLKDIRRREAKKNQSRDPPSAE